MPSAKDVYTAQRKLEDLKATLGALQNRLYEEANSGKGGALADPFTVSENHPEVIGMKREIAKQEETLKTAQEEIGGKVYRIPAENFDRFEKKVAKLNRKAVKLNCTETTYRRADEEEEVRKIDGKKQIFVWYYVIMNASIPMVPGYRFLAALDHTVQQNEGDPVIVKQVPNIEEELDLSEWRHADARCEHCDKVRSRNTTYLVEEIATGKISKVGSSCLRDFTGANDPDRVANFLEYLIQFEDETDSEGENYSGGRIAYTVVEYLTHVAAVIRSSGWSPRSAGGYATADAAWSNIRMYGKRGQRDELLYVPLKEEDGNTAKASIEWAKGLEGKSDFEHNLKTMANLTYMPKKGDGIVAFIVQGFVKDETKRIEREAEEKRKEEERENAEPITKGRQQISGTVVKRYSKESDYGITEKMTILDDRGFKVNGSVPRDLLGVYWGSEAVKEGDHVTFTATVEPKEGDEFYGWYKRPTKATIDQETAHA